MESLSFRPRVCLVFLCLVVLLSVHTADGKKNKNPNKNKKDRPLYCRNRRTWLVATSDLQVTPMTLRCPRGPVVSADVIALSGKCKGSTGYTRWIEGRCRWNTTCQLGFQDRVMDQLAPTAKDKSCLGTVPQSLQTTYTCLRKKTVVMNTLGEFSSTGRKNGVIRSHALFPWSYRSGVRLGNVTLTRPHKPRGLSTLWVTVSYYAILNSDLLFFSWTQAAPSSGRRRQQQPDIRAIRLVTYNDTTFRLDDVSKVNLTFYADYSKHRSELQGEDKGFLLCFQWLKPNAKLKKGSACSRVMMPAKCPSKKAGKKPAKGPGKNKGNNRGSRGNRQESRDNRQRSRDNRQRSRGNNKRSRGNNKRSRGNNRPSANNNNNNN